jgi:hypothetical protein
VEVEEAAIAHRCEEGGEGGGQLVRVVTPEADDPAERVARQQADIFREEAEEELRQEVGGAVRLGPARAEAIGQRGEAAGGILRDLLDGRARSQQVRAREEGAQEAQRLRFDDLLVGETMDLLGRAGEVGVDLEPFDVADDQQRRVLQRLAVEEELVIGGGEVFVLPFVLPGEVAAHPDIGEAFAAAGFGDPLLEGIPRAGRVGGGGRLLTEEGAEIEEVLLHDGALVLLHAAPFGRELLRGQGAAAHLLLRRSSISPRR